MMIKMMKMKRRKETVVLLMTMGMKRRVNNDHEKEKVISDYEN